MDGHGRRYGAPTMLEQLLTELDVARPIDDAGRTRLLVAAVQRRCLRPVLVELAAEGAPVDDQLAAVQRLRDLAAIDADDVAAVLAEAGVRARTLPLGVDDELLRLVRLKLPDVRATTRAVEVLEASGMRRWGPTGNGAWRSYQRSHGRVTLTRLDDQPTRVELVWRDEPGPRDGLMGKLQRALTPGQADFDAVALPGFAWPIYWLVRPVRLLLSRMGVRRRATPGDDLGPYLATPTGLASAFVDHAGIGASDLVVDLGCGDGRLLIDAVARRRCRGRGIERDPGLVDLARRNVARAGLEHQIEIVHADAATAPLDDVDVVLIFLPAEVVARLIGTLLARLRPGARVLAHEQVELSAQPPPVRSAPLITDAGVTVVHEWTA